MKYKWFAEQKISGLGIKRKNRIEKWKLSQLLKFAGPKIKLLELGPGIGIFAKLCKGKGIDYTAIDSNEKLCENLSKEDFNVIKSSVPPIPRTDSSFDVVYIDQLLEHMAGFKEAMFLIEDSHRILKGKGLLCVIVPDYISEKDTFFDIDYTHSFITTHRRLSQMFYDQGFQILCLKRYICGLTGWPASVLHFLALPFKNEFARSLFAVFCMEKLWFKIRKNLFELLIIIGKK